MSDINIQNVLAFIDSKLKSLKEEIANKNIELNSLENMVKELKKLESDSGYKEKFDDLSKQHELEKERLLKLHNHFKKIEQNRKNLKAELDAWKKWFSQNKELFDKLFSASPPDSSQKEKGKKKSK